MWPVSFLIQAGGKVMEEQRPESADPLWESGIKRITSAASKGPTAARHKRTTDTRKEGWSFRGWAWKGKHHPLPPSLIFFFERKQKKNSAPWCGLRCLTTKGIFTTLKSTSEDTKTLRIGHHSEWLEPYNWEGCGTLKPRVKDESTGAHEKKWKHKSWLLSGPSLVCGR